MTSQLNRLPIEYPLVQALSIYAQRLGAFLIIVFVNLLGFIALMNLAEGFPSLFLWLGLFCLFLLNILIVRGILILDRRVRKALESKGARETARRASKATGEAEEVLRESQKILIKMLDLHRSALPLLVFKAYEAYEVLEATKNPFVTTWEYTEAKQNLFLVMGQYHSDLPPLVLEAYNAWEVAKKAFVAAREAEKVAIKATPKGAAEEAIRIDREAWREALDEAYKVRNEAEQKLILVASQHRSALPPLVLEGWETSSEAKQKLILVMGQHRSDLPPLVLEAYNTWEAAKKAVVATIDNYDYDKVETEAYTSAWKAETIFWEVEAIFWKIRRIRERVRKSKHTSEKKADTKTQESELKDRLESKT